MNYAHPLGRIFMTIKDANEFPFSPLNSPRSRSRREGSRESHSCTGIAISGGDRIRADCERYRAFACRHIASASSMGHLADCAGKLDCGKKVHRRQVHYEAKQYWWR